MKCKLLLLIFFFSIIVFGQKQNKSVGFIENKGQIVNQNGKENKSVLYLLNTHGLNVQLKKNGFSYDIYETKKHALSKKVQESRFTSAFTKEDTLKNPNYTLEYIYHRIDIDFVNSNKLVNLVADEKSTDYDNYYNVAHAPNGITNVHKFKKITYKNIYSNIDVVFFIPDDTSKAVEYNFIVRPGGKISDIQLKFNGAQTELVDNKIKMTVRFGSLEETIPLSWTEEGNSKKEAPIYYREIKNNVYGFGGVLAADKTVIIDPVPVRLWGTFYGDKSNNYYGLGTVNVTTDSNGNSYMTGSTSASNSSFASSGAHQISIPQFTYLSTNGIIAKFNPNGERLWGTYYGGQDYNTINDIKIDYQNNVIVTGQTKAQTNISTLGAHKTNLSGDSDAFLVKFNDLGVRIWGTYFGGSNNDSASALDIDNQNNIYIVGVTSSQNGISLNCNFQSQLNTGNQYDIDAFIAKFNQNGSLIWGSYAGGENQDHFTSIVVKNNYLVVGGNTSSYNNISTNGVFQQIHDNNGHPDGVIYKFSINGFRLWSTYYGGEQVDDIFSVEVDDEDNIYIGGETASNNNMTTPGSFEVSNQSGYKGFFAKLDYNGIRIWGSYLGAASVYSIVFRNNSIYLGATGTSFNQILTNSCSYNLNTNGSDEGYIGKFSKDCNFIWGSFVGGNASVGGFSLNKATKIALDSNNYIYVAGVTIANDGIADSNSYQQTILGLSNYFLMKFLENSLTVMSATSNSPICIGNSIQLNATGGTNYSWTGPNGYTSNQQNPIITNATLAQSGQYACTITGSCDNTITVDVVVGDNVNPIPSITNLPDIAGDCNTTVTTIPTALDNCAGAITATTNDPLNYSTSGTHVIHWNYNDGNGNISSQNQNVIISETALPILNSPQKFCIQQSASLNSIAITGQNIKWYDDAMNGNLLANTTLLIDGVTYYASQTINNCESDRVPVIINIQNTPPPTGTNQSFCSSQNATLNDIMVTGIGINWYATNNSTAILPSTTQLTDGVTYYATQTLNTCESVSRLSITITLINTLNATNFAVEFCDDLNDGTEIINLAAYNANLISNVNCTFAYYNSLIGATNQTTSDQIINTTYTIGLGLKTIFVRITSSNGCHQIVELRLTLQAKPILSIRDIEPICENSTVTIYGDLGYDDYTWSTGEKTTSITISNPGDYFLTVIKKYATIDCSTTKNFKVVKSNVATISEIITSDWTVNDNSIIIVVTTNSVGDYEYSLDGINYQNSNVFSGLNSGEYDVFVRDRNGCGNVKDNTYLLMYPKFFTPNGDGYNDKWKIKFSNNEPNLTIKIFDRFGKFLKELDNNSSGWDGTFNGQELPSTDYWFTVIRANGKEYQGHFAMKR